MLSIGIDIGVAGGVAAISAVSQSVIQMPIFEGTAGGSKSKTDIVAVRDWILSQWRLYRQTLADRGMPDDATICVTLESVHAMPGQGVTSMFNFGMGFGMLQAMALCEGWRLQLVTPQAWKGSILAGTPKDKTAAIEHVRATFPALDLNVGVRKIKYHDGMADAVCLAEYGAKIAK